MRKGEQSSIVLFWKVDEAPTEEDLDRGENERKSKRRFLLRQYRVFNIEQCELPQAKLDKLPRLETHEHDPIEAAEKIIAEMPNPPEIQYAGSKAFYSSTTDRITLPPRELFVSAEEFYATALHEICTVASVLVDGAGSVYKASWHNGGLEKEIPAKGVPFSNGGDHDAEQQRGTAERGSGHPANGVRIRHLASSLRSGRARGRGSLGAWRPQCTRPRQQSWRVPRYVGAAPSGAGCLRHTQA